MLDANILQALNDRPDLPTLVALLNRLLESEQKAREQFRRDLTPNVKSEFIAGEVVIAGLEVSLSSIFDDATNLKAMQSLLQSV